MNPDDIASLADQVMQRHYSHAGRDAQSAVVEDLAGELLGEEEGMARGNQKSGDRRPCHLCGEPVRTVFCREDVGPDGVIHIDVGCEKLPSGETAYYHAACWKRRGSGGKLAGSF